MDSKLLNLLDEAADLAESRGLIPATKKQIWFLASVAGDNEDFVKDVYNRKYLVMTKELVSELINKYKVKN